MGDLADQTLGDDLRIRVRRLALEHGAARHSDGPEPLDPLRCRPLGERARDRCRQLLLRAELCRVVGHEVGRVDGLVVEAEQGQEGLPLREVQTRDGEVPVRGLEAAVVRVHRDTAAISAARASRCGAICSPWKRGVRLSREPDEILDLDRHRRRQERDVDELSLAGLARADERGEHSGREQEAGREVGHRDPARAHRHVVAT